MDDFTQNSRSNFFGPIKPTFDIRPKNNNFESSTPEKIKREGIKKQFSYSVEEKAKSNPTSQRDSPENFESKLDRNYPVSYRSKPKRKPSANNIFYNTLLENIDKKCSEPFLCASEESFNFRVSDDVILQRKKELIDLEKRISKQIEIKNTPHKEQKAKETSSFLENIIKKFGL